MRIKETDGKQIGTYDPIPKPAPFGEGKKFKDVKLDSARTKYWLGVGAQPSDPAWRLLSLVGLSLYSSFRYGDCGWMGRDGKEEGQGERRGTCGMKGMSMTSGEPMLIFE